MDMIRATLSSKGQVVIPASLRKKHRLRAGTQVVMFEDPLGRIVLQPVTEQYIDRVTGFLGPGSKLTEQRIEERRSEGERDKF